MSRRQFLASAAGMAAAFLAMNEVFGPLFESRRAEAAAARRGRGARGRLPDRAVHRRRADALRARRLQAGGLLGLAKYAKQNWNPALERRERRSTATSSRTTSRRCSSTATPRWRCCPARPSTIPAGTCLTNDQIVAAPRRHQQDRRLAAHARALGLHAQERRLDGRGRPVHRHAQARQLEGLHHRRSALPVQERLVLAPGRREAHVSVLREGREVRHQHHLHPQGTAAGRLREVVARRLEVRDRLGPRQGRQGLAARSTSSSITPRCGRSWSRRTA